jgi:hypothetical protein
MARLMPDLNAARVFTKLANQEGYERLDLGSGICDEWNLPSYRHPPKWRRLIAAQKVRQFTGGFAQTSRMAGTERGK